MHTGKIKPTRLERYRKVMQRYSKMSDFGVAVCRADDPKPRPTHVNTRSHPCPRIALHTETREPLKGVPMTLTPKMELAHLQGVADRALFHVGRSDRKIALLAIDIDCSQPGEWQMAADYGLTVLRSFFPNIETFAEPGRSYPRKAGAYIWFKINWGQALPQERRKLENLFNRQLRAMAATIPAPTGVKFDGLKGTVTYREPNPHYDSRYAASESPDGCWVCEITPDTWLPRYQAIKAFRAMDIPEEHLNQWLGELATRWENLTRLESYERYKLFYKINGAAFAYQRRLERIRRHFGTLVTRPCFGALSGQRPNNVDSFIEWAGSKDGVVTLAKLVRALPGNIRQRLRLRASQDNAQCTATSTQPPDGSMALHIQSASGPRGNDRLSPDIAADPTEDANRRLWAYAGMQLRKIGRADDLAQELAVQRTLAWYEGPDGPATGHSAQEHAEREDRIRRVVVKLAASFDPSQLSRYCSALRVTNERVMEVAEGMRRFITDAMIRAITDNPRVTRRSIAAVYLAMVHNINTGNLGEVPSKSIYELLRAAGITQTNSTIARCKTILIAAGLLMRVRGHFHEKGQRGRCEVWAVRVDIWVPEGICPYLNPEACWPRPDVALLTATRETGVAA